MRRKDDRVNLFNLFSKEFLAFQLKISIYIAFGFTKMRLNA